jgi:hypothetical protein
VILKVVKNVCARETRSKKKGEGVKREREREKIKTNI